MCRPEDFPPYPVAYTTLTAEDWVETEPKLYEGERCSSCGGDHFPELAPVEPEPSLISRILAWLPW